MGDGRRIRRQDQAAIGHARERLDCALDVGGGFDMTGHNFDRERRRYGLCRSQEVIKGGRLAVPHERGAREARRNLLEHRQPLADDARLEVQHAGEIAARPRHARNEACADRIGDIDEYDRDRAALPLQPGGGPSRMCEDHVGLQADQLFGKRRNALRPGGREAIVEADIATLRPSASFQPLPERCEARLRFRIVLGDGHEHADAPHPAGLLRARRERPRRAAPPSSVMNSRRFIRSPRRRGRAASAAR